MKLSQCPGKHEFRYRVYPHAGHWNDVEIYKEIESLILPVELLQTGAHQGDLPQRQSFMELLPAGLALSAFKRSEDGSSLIVRVFNPDEKRVDGSIRFSGFIQKAELVTLEEKVLSPCEVQNNALRFVVDPKKIVTIRVIAEKTV